MNKIIFLTILVISIIFRFTAGYAFDLYLIPLFTFVILRNRVAKDYEFLLALGITTFLFSQTLFFSLFCTYVIFCILDFVKHLFHKNEILFYGAALVSVVAYKIMELSLWSLKTNGNLELPNHGSILIPAITGTIGGLILLTVLRRYEPKTIKASHI